MLSPGTDRVSAVEFLATARGCHTHSELFDLSVDLFDGNYQVRDRSKYIKAVVEAIHAQGVCAVEEFEETAVKTSNAFNEQYNIWISTGGYDLRSLRRFLCFALICVRALHDGL